MMAYQGGFVVSVIHNGKPVREFRGEDGRRTCSIPFGSEYKLRIKSTDFNYARVSVTIDGTPVISGNRCFMLDPHGQLDLERFVDSLTEGKRFKFVSVNHVDVQDPTSSENGVIRVEIQPVMRYPVVTVRTCEAPQDGVFYTASHCTNVSATLSCSDAGATVEGSDSFQSFGLDTNDYVTSGPMTVIELKLCGTKVSRSNPWKVCGGEVFYNGAKLENIKSVMTNTSGEVVIYLDRITST